MTTQRHYLDHAVRWPLKVMLIGCGGNGAQMLTGLASLNVALNAIGNRSMDVLVFDDDVVSTANIGRQPFYPCDVGRPKASVLTERINLAYGFSWKSHIARITSASDLTANLVISCVDTASARRAISHALTACETYHSIYWLDLGNRATDGQIVLGQTEARSPFLQPRLPTVVERFPELGNEDIPEDDAPSCSLAEALERQSLFVNRVIASHALALLYELLVKGSISHAGLFINIAAGVTAPMALPKSAKPEVVPQFEFLKFD